MTDSKDKKLPAVVGKIYRAAHSDFEEMIAEANRQAKLGYTFTAITALGTSSFGVVFVHDGKSRAEHKNFFE
jgi:hypothetical protein